MILIVGDFNCKGVKWKETEITLMWIAMIGMQHKGRLLYHDSLETFRLHPVLFMLYHNAREGHESGGCNSAI